MKNRIKAALARAIQDNRRLWLARQFARIARFYDQSWEFSGFELETNGEASLLASLKNEPINIVFDVGANVGDWTSLAAKAFPSACIHAFEPVPPTFKHLQNRVAAIPNAKAHPFGLGLGSATDQTEIHYYGDELSFLSTVGFAIQTHLPSTKMPIEIRKGDDVVRENGIPRIDLLKLDVEGMEIEVLRGFTHTLAERGIGIVQFEHHPGKVLLKDFHDMLNPLGYRIGKMYSRYVDFSEYHVSFERYAGPNYLAVPQNRPELIAWLSTGYR